ncbi:hypothetical protein [Geosporobacter ferrireducens]|uniref:Spore coat protein n=1 Tax=Geosporobacter ferrireducens TaxID=1424294 RepID=A0A1D8GBB4_9FIRM|nr:hypothetical protein [Geosporobacter ferrireducens]AOT68192.1 hypothetical protein Gferi_00485 [Geosporobacter ferrireducens]MTI54242.1 hypothetical protein [Geosporobacter ferrireducens]
MDREKISKAAAALLLAGAIALSASNLTRAQAAENKYQIGNRFSNKALNTTENTYIIDYQSADVTGDNEADHILLIGDKLNSKDDIYAENLRIIVQDGKSKIYSEATCENLSGYEGTLFLGDFDGDKIKDVMLSAATGGSGGIIQHLIASFKDNTSIVIFGEKDNYGATIDGKYIDGFLAEIEFIHLGKTIRLDLSSSKDAYIDLGIYDKDGKLLSETIPYAIPFSKLSPIDYNGDGTYEICGYQRIIGSCNADTISEVESLWKYENEKWKISGLQYSTFLIK